MRSGAASAISASPFLRSASDRVPSVEASDSFCDSSTETSSVAVLGLAGLLDVGSAFRSTPSTRAFWTTT